MINKILSSYGEIPYPSTDRRDIFFFAPDLLSALGVISHSHHSRMMWNGNKPEKKNISHEMRLPMRSDDKGADDEKAVDNKVIRRHTLTQALNHAKGITISKSWQTI